jgi:hypothetical protein
MSEMASKGVRDGVGLSSGGSFEEELLFSGGGERLT